MHNHDDDDDDDGGRMGLEATKTGDDVSTYIHTYIRVKVLQIRPVCMLCR